MCLWLFFLILIFILVVLVLRLFFSNFLIIDVGCLIILLVVIWFVSWGDKSCIGKGLFYDINYMDLW